MTTRLATPIEVTTDPRGQLVIAQRPSTLLRIVAIPFLLVGVYLLSQLVAGLLGGDLTLAGGIVLPLFALAFLVPGWILLASRTRTVLDPAARRIVREVDYRIHRRRREQSIPAGARVEVFLETRRTERDDAASRESESAGTHTFAVLEISASRTSSIELAVLDGSRKSDAEELGRRVAALLDLPCGQGGERNEG